MGRIFITSDTHFCHNREFLYCPRDFYTVEDMNSAIIKNWNEVVDMDDDVYLLGDVMLNDNEEGLRCLKELKGRIHIIIGNHDTDTRIELYKQCWNVVEVNYGARLKVGKRSFYLSHYPTLIKNEGSEGKVFNLCGHSHTKDKWLHWEYGCYHCELDAHDCRPVLLDDIILDIKEKNK